jgi:hypothetical protein
MMGWQIVRHSFVLLFRNLSDALKISLGPLLIGVVVALLVASATGLPPELLTQVTNPALMMQISQFLTGSAAFGLLFILIMVGFITAWVAVNWHRFVLLEEYPGLLPALSGRPIGGYFWRVILLTLVLVVVSLPVSFIVSLFLAPLLASGAISPIGIVAMALGILLAAFLSWVWLRLALILPSAAVGRQMGMGESWTVTGRISGAIFQAGLILMVINGVAGYAVEAFFGASVIGLVLGQAVTWVSLMVGVSILTTLYGHLVEDRVID